MKNFTKLALVLSITGASMVAAAADVTLRYGQADRSYTYSNMTVEDGQVTVNLTQALPEAGDVCGDGTVLGANDRCEPDFAFLCGSNTEQSNGRCVGTGGTLPTSSSSSSSSSSSAPPVDVGNCSIPGNVSIGNTRGLTDFGSATNTLELLIPRSPGIISTKVQTNGYTEVTGQVNMVGDVTTASHSRRMWISQCPGGAVLNGSSKCVSEGADITLRWAQRSIRTACALDTNATYYFNVSYVSNDTHCNKANGCYAFIQHLGGW